MPCAERERHWEKVKCDLGRILMSRRRSPTAGGGFSVESRRRGSDHFGGVSNSGNRVTRMTRRRAIFLLSHHVSYILPTRCPLPPFPSAALVSRQFPQGELDRIYRMNRPNQTPPSITPGGFRHLPTSPSPGISRHETSILFPARYEAPVLAPPHVKREGALTVSLPADVQRPRGVNNVS